MRTCLIRDRDFETVKRVIGLSNKDAVDKVRALWTKVCNDALRGQTGYDSLGYREIAFGGSPPEQRQFRLPEC